MSDSDDATPPQSRVDRPAREDQTRRRAGPTVVSVLRTAISRLGSDRGLALPFSVAGIVVAAIDLARRLDPIPVVRDNGGDGVSVDVEYYLFPTGSPEALRPLRAIVELQPQYLIWAVALEVVALLAVGLAGWLVFTRALDRSTDLASATRYFGIFALLIRIPRLLGGTDIEFTDGGLIVGIPLIVLWMLLLVRLFLLPVFLVAGRGLIEATRESRRASRGAGWTIFGIILVVGLGASLLGELPAIGGGVSTAVVGPIHAVAAVVLYERLTPSAVD